jgi:hypothetical protein
MHDKHNFITLNAENHYNYRLTELTKRLVLRKWLSNIMKLLLISFEAKAQQTERYLWRKSDVLNVLKSLMFLTDTLIPTASESAVKVINITYK